MFTSVGGSRSAVSEPEADPAEAVFVTTLAAALEDFLDRGTFERFAMVAPARMLGALRGELGRLGQAQLCAELAKDLTKLPQAKLHPMLDQLMLRASPPA